MKSSSSSPCPRDRAGREAGSLVDRPLGPTDRIVEELKQLGLPEPLDRVPRVRALAGATIRARRVLGRTSRRASSRRDWTSPRPPSCASTSSTCRGAPRDGARPLRQATSRSRAASQHPRVVRRAPRGHVAGSAARFPSPRGFWSADRPQVGPRARRLSRTRARAVGLRARPGTPALVTQAQADSSYPILLHTGSSRLRDPSPRGPRLRLELEPE